MLGIVSLGCLRCDERVTDELEVASNTTNRSSKKAASWVKGIK